MLHTAILDGKWKGIVCLPRQGCLEVARNTFRECEGPLQITAVGLHWIQQTIYAFEGSTLADAGDESCRLTKMMFSS